MADAAKPAADAAKSNAHDPKSDKPGGDAVNASPASTKNGAKSPSQTGQAPASAPPQEKAAASPAAAHPLPAGQTEATVSQSPDRPSGAPSGKPAAADAPTPVVSGMDRPGFAPDGAAKRGARAGSPVVAEASVQTITGNNQPGGTNSAPSSAATAGSSGQRDQPVATPTPYRPSGPQSDWRAEKDAAGPAQPSTMRPLLLGAAGGALAALLIVVLLHPGATSGAPAPATQNDGKVATALEEIEKERSVSSERNSAVERSAADLGARLAALEQQAAAGATTASAAQADAVTNRLKALEQKLAAVESRGAPATATGDDAAITSLNERLAGLEQRINSASAPAQSPGGNGSAANAGVLDPTTPRNAERAPPLATYAPDPADQGFRPPGLIPEPDRPRVTAPVRGWVLHNVYGGVAVLESRTAGIVEVRRGQNVQGLGRIAGIERRGNRWVVTTDRGVIASPVN